MQILLHIQGIEQSDADAGQRSAACQITLDSQVQCSALSLKGQKERNDAKMGRMKKSGLFSFPVVCRRAVFFVLLTQLSLKIISKSFAMTFSFSPSLFLHLDLFSG